MLLPTVSRPVCLGIKHPSGAYDQICITVRQLRVRWCGADSLTRGWVCRLQFMLALAIAVILGSESRRTRDHILLSQIRDFPFCRLLRLAGLRWRYSSPPPHRIWLNFRVRVTLRLAVYRQSVRLGAEPLEIHGQNFFQLSTCGHSPYVTSSQTRGWVCRLQFLQVFASAFILRSESRRTHDHILLSQMLDSPTLEPRSPYLYPPGTGWSSYTPRHWVLFPSPFTTRRATVEVIRTLFHTLEGRSAMPWRINSMTNF
jgi:hypothetical protein